MKAITLLSGGLDSCVATTVAIRKGWEVTALSFDYNQKHIYELDCSKVIAEKLGIPRVVVQLDLGGVFKQATALVEGGIDVPTGEAADASGIPITYVPSRNIIFLSIASALAQAIGAEIIVTGFNAVDWAGYPDCTQEFVDAFEKVLEVGTKDGVEGRGIWLFTPVIHLSKSDIIKLGYEVSAPLELTMSCYNPISKVLSCGICSSCRIRRKGFKGVNLSDPMEYKEDKNVKQS